MGLLDGKVAVVSGAARGQGRSHAIRLAEEGADIIAFDLCADVASVPYPLATEADLEQTTRAVQETGRRIVASVTDVRDAEATGAAIRAGARELGGLDVVVPNAGIVSYVEAAKLGPAMWDDMIAVNLTGVWNTISAALPALIEGGNGGSIVITSSSAAHVGVPNTAHYAAAKAGLVGLMQSLAVELAPHMIRVNTVHPTGVNTPMLQNPATYGLMSGGTATEVDPDAPPQAVADALRGLNALPITWIEAVDVSNAIVYLASDLARYVTGTQLRVDAGSAAK